MHSMRGHRRHSKIAEVYKYAVCWRSLVAYVQLKCEDILLPRQSLIGVFGQMKDLRGVLAQEGMKPTNHCGAKVIISLKEQVERLSCTLKETLTTTMPVPVVPSLHETPKCGANLLLLHAVKILLKPHAFRCALFLKDAKLKCKPFEALEQQEGFLEPLTGRQRIIVLSSDCVIAQIIRCMEGRQNFIAIEKCSATHTVQLAEEEHQMRMGLESQEVPQHFRAVASLGEYDALPAATILGPPYGGVLRPSGELAMMQVSSNCGIE